MAFYLFLSRSRRNQIASFFSDWYEILSVSLLRFWIFQGPLCYGSWSFKKTCFLSSTQLRELHSNSHFFRARQQSEGFSAISAMSSWFSHDLSDDAFPVQKKYDFRNLEKIFLTTISTPLQILYLHASLPVATFLLSSTFNKPCNCLCLLPSSLSAVLFLLPHAQVCLRANKSQRKLRNSPPASPHPRIQIVLLLWSPKPYDGLANEVQWGAKRSRPNEDPAAPVRVIALPAKTVWTISFQTRITISLRIELGMRVPRSRSVCEPWPAHANDQESKFVWKIIFFYHRDFYLTPSIGFLGDISNRVDLIDNILPCASTAVVGNSSFKRVSRIGEARNTTLLIRDFSLLTRVLFWLTVFFFVEFILRDSRFFIF